MYIAPPKSSMMIAIHIVESSVRFRRMVYEGGAKAGAECSCVWQSTVCMSGCVAMNTGRPIKMIRRPSQN